MFKIILKKGFLKFNIFLSGTGESKNLICTLCGLLKGLVNLSDLRLNLRYYSKKNFLNHFFKIKSLTIKFNNLKKRKSSNLYN